MDGGAGGPPPSAEPISVTVVHTIKCRLGYAEVHKAAPGYQQGEVSVHYTVQGYEVVERLLHASY